MGQVLGQRLIGLEAQEMDIFLLLQGGQIHPRLFPADEDKIPVRPRLGRRQDQLIADALLQRADKAEDRPLQRRHLPGHRLGLGRLGKALVIGPVGDKHAAGICRLQALAQALGRGKDLICCACQLQLHAVHQRRIHLPAIGRMPVHTVIDQSAVGDLPHQVAADRRIHPQDRVINPVLLHFLADEPGDLLLIPAVDPPEAIEKRQDRRQAVDMDILLRCQRRGAVGLELFLRLPVPQGGKIRHRRVKI